jgi:hypothetical protein
LKALTNSPSPNCKLKINFEWVINHILAAALGCESQDATIQAPWVVARAELADNSCLTGEI